VPLGHSSRRALRHASLWGPVFAYILEGNIENQVDPEPSKIYHPGDFFHEPAMHVHRLLRNLSSTQPARLITFTVGETGKVGESAKPNPAIKTLLQEQAEVANRQGRLSILSLEPGWWGAGFQGGQVVDALVPAPLAASLADV